MRRVGGTPFFDREFCRVLVPSICIPTALFLFFVLVIEQAHLSRLQSNLIGCSCVLLITGGISSMLFHKPH
ncbi:MAG: hypothetical protein H7A36_05980 [Chlamydiales bacterium]|nr:hypothetical protein [Chlamydiales bacterium]